MIDDTPKWIVTWGIGIRCNRCKESIECDGSENWHAQVERFVEKHSECPEPTQ